MCGLPKTPIVITALVIFLTHFSIAEVNAEEPPCADGQLQIAKASMVKAKVALDKAIAAIDSVDDATSRKLIEWFGARSPADGATVRKTLVASRAFADGVNFRCAIKTDIKIGDVYAYVTPDKLLVITLGAFFFSASEKGFSSRLGVLVHEMSHFTIAGATKDPKIYGPDEAKSLAKRDPDEALRNAENIEYFVEAINFNL